MNILMANVQIIRRPFGRGISVVAAALLAGGLLIPISPASADSLDVTISITKDYWLLGIAINPGGTYAYVTNELGTVSRINLATNMVDATINTFDVAGSVTINPAGTFAYVIGIGESAMVSRINLATNKVDAEISNSGQVSMAINPTGTFAYVASIGFNRVIRINLASNKVDATIQPVYLSPKGAQSESSSSQAIAINPAGTFAYVTSLPYFNYKTSVQEAGVVSRINLATNKVDATIIVGDEPEGIAINPAGTFAYIADRKSGTISRINLATNKLDTTIKVGDDPRYVRINPTGTFAYVTNRRSNTVSKINLATNNVDATIAVGKKPSDLAINPFGTFAYVVNEGSGTVSKIKLANAIPLVTPTEPVSSSAIAAYSKLTIPNGATISINVAPSSTKYCKVSGSTLRGIKTGPCTVSVSVKPKSGKAVSKTMTFTVSK